MTKKQYYKTMANFNEKDSFEVNHKKWLDCFTYILKSFKVGATKEFIKSLFYDWGIENWKAMWLENSEYKTCTQEELKDHFCGECSYISDHRTSYDRLFRTHWLFRQAYKEELDRFMYPSFYMEII